MRCSRCGHDPDDAQFVVPENSFLYGYTPEELAMMFDDAKPGAVVWIEDRRPTLWQRIKRALGLA